MTTKYDWYACRWFKNGDHPHDNCRLLDVGGEKFKSEGQVVRYYRNPSIEGKINRCPHCTHLVHDHGWIDTPPNGYTVCPGDFIIAVNGEYFPLKPYLFDKMLLQYWKVK